MVPYPQYDSQYGPEVWEWNTPWGYSNYDSLIAKAEKRFNGTGLLSNDLSFTTAFTWSKVISATSLLNNGLLVDPGPYYGIDSSDRAFLFSFAGIYKLPIGTGSLIASDARGVARFLCGIAIGLISVVAPMYLAEIAPSELRGRIVGSFQVNISIGVVTAFLASYLLSLHAHAAVAWRLSVAAGAIPALLCQLCLMSSYVSPPLPGRPEPLQLDPRTARQKLSQPNLFSRQYLRPIALAVSIAVFNHLTGVNAPLYYVLDIFKDLGSGQVNERADAITLSTLSLLVTLVAILVIDKIGHKPLLLTGAADISICLFLLPLIRHQGWPAYSVVIDIAIYNICFGFSQGAVIWVYLSKIFPLPVRARGQSLGSTAHWVTNAVVVGTFPVLTSHWSGKVFGGLGLLLVLQIFIISWCYPETNGRTLESLASGIHA